MTIEIHQPEIQDIIRRHLASGVFQDVEDVVIHALRNAPPPNALRGFTGAELLSAMQASPYKEIDLEPSRSPMPVRDVSL
jgi:hypothetical protein